jgi:flagellar hook-length control protein FliK
MSTAALIKDLLPPGPARAPAILRKPEQKADSPDFGRVLENSRQKAEPREKPVKRDAAKADVPRQEQETTRREDDKALGDRREAKDRPEPAARPATDRDGAPTDPKAQDGTDNAKDLANTETVSQKRESAKVDDKPTEAASASEQTPSITIVAQAPTTIAETALTTDLTRLASDTIQPETNAAKAVVATQDQASEANKPAETTASAANAAVTAPVPAAPASAVQATTAETDQPLQAISGEKTAQTAPSATNALPMPEGTKAKGEETDAPTSASEKAVASGKPEIQQAAQQTSPAAAKELARAVEKLVEPTVPTSGQPNAQTALQTTAADALASTKPQDPANALARADAPVPLQAIAVEIGMRAMRGSKEFSIRLDPEDLGRIDIKLEISEAGQVQAKLVVERVETLQLLQRDAKTLERAFDQAGLKTNPDGLQFSLRDPGQQGRRNGQQHDQPNFGSKNKDSAMIDEITLRPAIYRTAISGGLDIRI